MNANWDSLSIGERIVRAAWMAVREHLQPLPPPPLAPAIEPPEPERAAPDQAAELRRWVAIERAASREWGREAA